MRRSALSAIEINATFYGRQKLKSWESWAKVAPEGFQFAVKGSRFCVMKTKLAEAGEGLGGFFAQGFAALGPKLGPILWQFASRRKFDRDDIAAFIDLCLRSSTGSRFATRSSPGTKASTTRSSSSFAAPATSRSCFEDSDEYPCIEADTADFAYARLQRMNEDIETGYEDAALDGFAERAREMAQGRPRRLHIHDQWRESPGSSRCAGAAATCRKLICVNFAFVLQARPERRRCLPASRLSRRRRSS